MPEGLRSFAKRLNPLPALQSVAYLEAWLGKRPSLIKAAINRLDSLMAIGESRYEVKRAAREQNPSVWTVSDDKIHSHLTRAGYQQHVLAFANWARAQGIRTLPDLDSQASALVSRYLTERIDAGNSPFTLQAIRAALRMFFSDRALADDVKLPRRTREGITRSRGPAKRDSHFQPANWQPLIGFLTGTGLREHEVRALQARDVRQTEEGRAEVHFHAGKGGRPRTVVAREGYTEAVLAAVEGKEPLERVFPRIPDKLDIHGLRREFAQGLYRELSGRELPPKEGRLRRSDYDLSAVAIVSKQLGHNRIDVTLISYLR